jgi:hypothetical protein
MHYKFTISALLYSAALLTGAHAVQAEPAVCKGMEQAPCTESGDCRWINSYKRSDGREINGYCRKLPARDVKDVSSTPEVKDTQPQKS